MQGEPPGPVLVAVGGEGLGSVHTVQASWEGEGREDCQGPKNKCSVQPCTESKDYLFSKTPVWSV